MIEALKSAQVKTWNVESTGVLDYPTMHSAAKTHIGELMEYDFGRM